ncbi:MAG: cupredoxin domain-containing protein [Ferruginibacter sp.]
MKKTPAYFLLLAAILLTIMYSCKKEKDISDIPGGNLPAKYIDIKDSTYSPAWLSTVAGTTITFVNNTATSHKIISHNNQYFDSVLVDPGRSFSFKKDADGTLEFHCKEHPRNIGTIVFTP